MDKGDYRTAPATPGLLKNINFFKYDTNMNLTPTKLQEKRRKQLEKK